MSSGKNEEPWLFDLPLTQPKEEAAPITPERETDAPARKPLPRKVPAAISRRAELPPSSEPAGREPERLHFMLAGLLDLAVILSALIAAVAGSLWLGSEPDLAHWPALVVFVLVFSFLYFVMPLAFWGQTPGMGWTGLYARDDRGEGLTFAQCTRRWLGALVTTLTLGAPWAFSWNLADRISRSVTYYRQP